MGVQGIQRDVDAVQSGLSQRNRLTVESDAVGGDGNVRARRQAGDGGNELLQVLEYQRLTTGESNAVNPEACHGDPDESDVFIGGEQCLAAQPVQSFGGHTVGAAQIAPVGQRHP